MKSRRAKLMLKLIRNNRKWFVGALLCTLICVAIEFATPLLLAETLDYYLSGAPSIMPPLSTTCSRAGAGHSLWRAICGSSDWC